MGCCCDSQQKAQDAVILHQIKRAVQEQEEIMNMEGDSLEQELIDEARQEPNQQKGKEAPKIEISEDEEDKSDKKKSKKKPTKKDDSYLKVIEYKSIKINHFILTSDEASGQYDLIINSSHFEFYYDVKCKAIIVTDQDKPFTIKPYTYEEASSNSNYDIFFRIDTYFSIDQSLNSNKQSFDQLLEVTRAIPRPQAILPSVYQVKNTFKEAQSPGMSPFRSPKKSKANQMQTELLTEMLEIIHVFDLELCPRFHQLLFALMIQQQLPLLKPYYINISDAYFLFDSKPTLDRCQIQKIAIFYEYWNYNLHELHDYLVKNEMQLAHLTFLRLSYDLIQIFYTTYRGYFYRCNFTLKSLFYISKSKKFKLQSFARIQTLIKFTNDPEQAQKLLQVVSEQKLKYFIRDFDKDLGAVCDIILLFKDVSNTLVQIKKVRRKKKNSDAHHVKYQQFAQSVLDFEEKDKLIYELIRLKSQQIGRDQYDYIIEEIRTLLITLEQQIIDETARHEKKKEAKEQQLLQSDVQQEQRQRYIDDEEESETKYLLTFDHPIPRETKISKKPPAPTKKSKHSKEQIDNTQEIDAFNQMKYTSLFYFDNFLDSSEVFLQLCTNDSLKAYTLMLQAVVKGNEAETRQQQQQIQQSLLSEATKILMSTSQHLIQDSFSYYLLIDIITKQHEKSYQLLNQLRFIIQQQNQIRKKWIRPRLTTTQQYNGIIEMRKAIILDLYYLELHMKKHQYNQALSLMQHSVTQQLRFNLKGYLLYGQTVFLNGVLCQRMMQYVSAMLNLEVCRLVFIKFFPSQKIIYVEQDTGKQVEIDQQESNKQYKQRMIYFSNEASENYNNLEFTLGQVYFSLGEKENALKCLREVKALRERKYQQFSDEVIEVVLQILRIHVEQEESGAAMEIVQEYFFKFKEAGKQNIIIKSRLIARLQLIMAAIYECNGMIISALRYYQKANRTFIQSKNNSYVRQLHILQKISKIVELIKQRAYQAMTLDTNYTYNIENYIGQLSEKVKPYFNNQFISQVRIDTVIYNPSLMRKYVRANQCLRNLELQSAIKRYQKIHEQFKKLKVDECYGFTLEKIGTVQLIDKNLKNGLVNLQMAIEIHDRYLQFPLKETHILTCNIYILIGHALSMNNKEVQKQMNILDDFIQSIQDQLQWTQVPYHSQSNKFAVLANKLGRQVLYQLNSLWEKIEKYQKLRFLFGQHLNDDKRLAKIATKFLEKKFNKLSDYSSQLCATRSSCLFGLFVHGRRRQAVSQAPTQLQVAELLKIHEKNESKKQKSIKVIQQNEQSIVQKQSHQNTQVSLKSENIQINFDKHHKEKEDNQSISKRSQPPTALASPLLSPINKSPDQLIQKHKKIQKIDPFAKVTRRK